MILNLLRNVSMSSNIHFGLKSVPGAKLTSNVSEAAHAMSKVTLLPPVPESFTTKKTQILSQLGQHGDAYHDKSPKGSVDIQIRELINEINAYAGLVTTSSCAGRIAVFVEGPKTIQPDRDRSINRVEGHDGTDDTNHGGERDEIDNGGDDGVKATTTTTSPGGKGGGRWLYVSHEPVPVRAPSSRTDTTDQATAQTDEGYFSALFSLVNHSVQSSMFRRGTPPRLIHLSFNPLILHVHCATLRHARPVLAAAINAGFRESGVQSLRTLDPAEAEKGVMLAVRTAGLSFATVVGIVHQDSDGSTEEEVVQRIVNEEYLAMCAVVVNERFQENKDRRERFRAELRSAMEREGMGVGTNTGEEERKGERTLRLWEDKDERRRRKREEGLQRQRLSKMAWPTVIS